MVPLTAARDWKIVPPPGVTSMNAFRAPAASESRTMTPARASALVLSSLATRATTSPTPVIGQ